MNNVTNVVTGHDIIVIGASAGGLNQFMAIVEELPEDLPAAIFVLQHLGLTQKSYMPEILSRITKLAVVQARHGDHIRLGTIYVAPGGMHLLLKSGKIELNRGARENGYRPAIDKLFRSAAREYGARVIGIVLSGSLYDGSHGLFSIKKHGGIAIVQDPAEAMHSSMPLNALNTVDVDYCLPGNEIGKLLPRLVRQPPQIAEAKPERVEEQPAMVSCPDCGGVMIESNSGGRAHFKCHTGHRYTAEGLYEEQSEAVEKALWSALRLLKEKSLALGKIVDREGDLKQRDYYKDQYSELRQHVTAISELLGTKPEFEIHSDKDFAAAFSEELEKPAMIANSAKRR